MKIRNGFVSNSSTSSFCFFGFFFEQEQEKIVKELQNKLYDDEQIDEGIEEILAQRGICYHSEATDNLSGNYGTVVGLKYSEFNNNETLLEFKTLVAARVVQEFENLGVDIGKVDPKDVALRFGEYDC